MFNESFSTAVERLGSQLWLETQASDAARQQYTAFNQRRQDFRVLTLYTRNELALIYKQKDAVSQELNSNIAIESIAKENAKILVMQDFKNRYAQLKSAWGGFSGYDPWVAKANNASFGAQAAYDELVPDFEALFEREGRDWHQFYKAVKRLADLPKDARRQALKTGL